MAADRKSSWGPQWAVAPGEVLTETLDERGMSQAELARRMARPLKTISEIVNGKASITPDTAIQLERALGVSASFWNGLETRYREALATDRALLELADFAEWCRAFPIAEMVRRRILPKRRSMIDSIADLLSFFRVSNPTGWEQQWRRPAASYRRTRAYEQSDYTLSAWLRWGEIEAQEIPTKPFDRRRLRRILTDVRELSRRAAFPLALERLRTILAEVGVVVLVLPELEGARVSGAARWLTNDRGLVQLSLRYRSDDQFWFSLFHELGHLLVGSRHESYVEDHDPSSPVANDSPSEAEADAFARDALIPPKEYTTFVAAGNFSVDAVIAFAEAQRISPGVVVGRLQYDNHIVRVKMNHLKRVYSLSS